MDELRIAIFFNLSFKPNQSNYPTYESDCVV